MIVNVYRDGLRFTVEAENVASAEAQVDYLISQVPIIYFDTQKVNASQALTLTKPELTECLSDMGVTEVRRA